MVIPRDLAEATSAPWLGSILGAHVTNVTVGTIDERVSTNVPVRVDLADGSVRDLWIKGYFSDLGWEYRHAGVPEALFYRELSGRLGIRTLRPVYADVDDATSANVVVTEDVVGSGATFLNALSEYSPDQAANSLEQLAQLHAHTWLDDVAEASWLANRLSFYTVRRGVAEITRNFESKVGEGVPEAVRQPTRLFEAFKSSSELAAADTPWGVIHGDPHIGNLFLDSRGQPTFLDWQLVQRGPWYLDVGYHLASALDVENRRKHEKDLVKHYLERLAAGGVDAPTADDAWERIIYGFVHGLYLWAITLRVDPAITATLVGRLGTAVEDHAVFTKIKA